MKADAITNRIMEDAREGASRILMEAHRRAEEMSERNKALHISQEAAAMESARRDCAELRDRMLRMAELDQRKEMLAMKRELISAAFDAALSEMRAMPVEKARAFVGKMLVEAAEGNEKVVISASDEGVFGAEFINDMNKKLISAGKPGKIALDSERRELGGGVILKSEGMELNLTYPSVLGETRTKLEAEVAEMLFNDQ